MVFMISSSWMKKKAIWYGYDHTVLLMNKMNTGKYMVAKVFYRYGGLYNSILFIYLIFFLNSIHKYVS